MYCYPSVTGAGNLLFLFLLIANASSVICAEPHVAVWILFSNWKSLECDVCAQRWLNVALRSQKKLFLTTAWNILGFMDGTPSVITEIRYWICYDACMVCFPREN